MDNSERIDKFLHDQMTSEEREAFLNDLRTDKDLRDEAQSLAMLIKEMKEQQAKEDAEIIEEVLSAKRVVSAKRKAKIIRMMKRVGPIAAMLVIVFSIGLGGNQLYVAHRMNVLFDEYYEPYHYEKTLTARSRGGESDVEKELADLFNQVGAAKDIKPVIEKLQTIYDNINYEYEYSLYAVDITWYLALAYIKDKNKEKAKELLLLMKENDDERAIQLLEELK